MAVLYMMICFLILSTGIKGVIITVPSEKTVIVEYGREVTLWCNFSYTGGENGNTRVAARLYLNGTNSHNFVYDYEQNGGSGNNSIAQALINHFQSRDSNIQQLRDPMAIGLKLEQTQWNDSGNYTWSMTVDRLAGSSQSNIHTNEVIVGRKPTNASLQYTQTNGTTYQLVCNIDGGKPVPTITISNTTNIIHTLVSDVSASVTLNITSDSVFHCAATNQLGSAISTSVQLPERPTTTEKATSPFTSTPDYSAVTQGPVSTEIPGSSTMKDATKEPTTPTPLEVHYIIIIAVSVCCVVVIVIIAVVCIHKHSANKRQANPDKENTTGAQAENQHDEMPMDSSKYQQEQEEKQQRNIEGLQYADLDLRPTGKTKPAGRDGSNKLVFNDDSHVEYAEVRKM